MNIETSAHAPKPPIRLGIAGLGLAGSFMIRAAVAHPKIALGAGMDPLPRPRDAFARQFNAPVYSEFHELCRDPSVEAIYISSPHQFHASQAVEAMQEGKHVLVEKPLALTLKECDEVVAAAGRAGLHLIVGHSHAFDPNIREMHRIIQSGELGKLGMILTFNYNDFLLRPHRSDEFESEKGGGILFNQVSHQIEIVRLLGGRLRSVRASVGALDKSRLAAGHCMAFLDFENDAAASVVFSSYDFFDSDELHQWISESGTSKQPHCQGKTREAFLARANDLAAHQALGFGARKLPTGQPYLPHFGLIVVTCEGGDMRLSPNGILVHGVHGAREVAVPRGPGRPGQGDALDALWDAVREGRRCVHDARWGRATVETILAILESSKTRREVRLSC